MEIHEYDKFEIPEEYKKMSRQELRAEAERVLENWRSVERPRREIESNKQGIQFLLK